MRVWAYLEDFSEGAAAKHIQEVILVQFAGLLLHLLLLGKNLLGPTRHRHCLVSHHRLACLALPPLDVCCDVGRLLLLADDSLSDLGIDSVNLGRLLLALLSLSLHTDSNLGYSV